MLNITLLKEVLLVAVASSIVSTAFIQRLKEGTKSLKCMLPKCFGLSFSIGLLFSLSFSSLNIIYSMWVGLVSFVGADAIYKAFEDKIFKSFDKIENVILIERKDI